MLPIVGISYSYAHTGRELSRRVTPEVEPETPGEGVAAPRSAPAKASEPDPQVVSTIARRFIKNGNAPQAAREIRQRAREITQGDLTKVPRKWAQEAKKRLGPDRVAALKKRFQSRRPTMAELEALVKQHLAKESNRRRQ